jgi:glycosyltransferase involved in cell wall biosynthesis
MLRPRWYDGLVALGRGPHSAPLLLEAGRRARGADVLLAGFVPFTTVWYGARIAARHGLPFVLLPFFHPEDRYHHFGMFYRAFAAADAVLAQSPYSAALFERLAAARAVQVGVGVERATAADPRVDGARFRAAHGLEDARIVLFVGRKEPSKRYDVAIDAVEALRDERVVLVMIGADVDRRPLTSPRVRYLGRVSRETLLDAYDACDVFVLPSAHESFGIVFLEAWMRGKPVLGNRDCGPVASVIEEGVDGFLCGDAAEFAARIRYLLDHPEAAAALAAASCSTDCRCRSARPASRCTPRRSSATWLRHDPRPTSCCTGWAVLPCRRSARPAAPPRIGPRSRRTSHGTGRRSIRW